jgi:hypothetical protein
MNKAKEFRKRQQKQAMLHAEDSLNAMRQLQQAIMVVFQKVYQLEQKISSYEKRLEIFDVRSLGTIRALDEKGLIPKEFTFALADKIVDENIAEQDQKDDKNRNLQEVDESLKAGYYAVFTLKAFKGDAEATDQDMKWGKVEVGKREVAQAIDDGFIGMKKGDTKRITIEKNETVDSVEVTILSVRATKTLPTEETPVQSEQVAESK